MTKSVALCGLEFGEGLRIVDHSGVAWSCDLARASVTPSSTAAPVRQSL